MAFLWSGLEQVGRQAVRFVLSVLLARLLAPDDYGLMGVLLVFMLIAQVFVDSGLSSGLIQRKEISTDDETSVFYVNVVAGILFAGVLCAIAPLVAAFYRQPTLGPLLCVSSIGVTIGSFGIVQNALLTRAVDFRTQAKVTLGSTVLAGLVGLGMAWRGCGVWSLAGQGIAQSLANVLLVWKWSPWRPKGHFRWASVRLLWPFSSRLLASGLLNTTFENLYSLVIGKAYSPADLGFYTRASSLAMLPASSVTSMTGRVMFPVFSLVQDEKESLKREFRRVVIAMAALYFPIMAGLASIAEPLVKCLLTGKWLPCVPYFQVICFSGMLYPLHALHLNVLMAQGRSELFLRLEIIKKVLVVVALVITVRMGVKAMVDSLLILSLVSLVLNSYYTRLLIHYGWGEQIRDLLPIVAASLGMASIVWSLGLLMPLNPWGLLGVQVVTGIGLYGGAAMLLRKHGYDAVWTIGKRVWGCWAVPEGCL